MQILTNEKGRPDGWCKHTAASKRPRSLFGTKARSQPQRYACQLDFKGSSSPVVIENPKRTSLFLPQLVELRPARYRNYSALRFFMNPPFLLKLVAHFFAPFRPRVKPSGLSSNGRMMPFRHGNLPVGDVILYWRTTVPSSFRILLPRPCCLGQFVSCYWRLA